MSTSEHDGADKEFTAEIEEYIVLKLELEKYRGSDKPFPAGCALADPADRARTSDEERALLQRYFRSWKGPFLGRLKGWRADSPLLVLRDGRLVAGVYLVAANEFDADARWGQLHYAFMDPSCKGQGIYSALFRAAVQRARSWGLAGLYLNSDRHQLPEVYERWGAERWKTLPKQPRVEAPRRSMLDSLRAWFGGAR